MAIFKTSYRQAPTFAIYCNFCLLYFPLKGETKFLPASKLVLVICLHFLIEEAAPSLDSPKNPPSIL